MEIEKVIREYVIENLLVDKTVDWNDDTDIVSTGFLDSLSIVKLMIFIEEEYDISIDITTDLEKFRTICTIADVVKSKLA